MNTATILTTWRFQAAALPVSDSSSTVSSGGSSTTTTPNTPNSSSTSSSSSTAPSSPSSPATSPPAVGSRQNVKRHSFTAMNTGHHPHPHHRHSAEILSPPVDSNSGTSNGGASDLSFSPSQVKTLSFSLILPFGRRKTRFCFHEIILIILLESFIFRKVSILIK